MRLRPRTKWLISSRPITNSSLHHWTQWWWASLRSTNLSSSQAQSSHPRLSSLPPNRPTIWSVSRRTTSTRRKRNETFHRVWARISWAECSSSKYRPLTSKRGSLRLSRSSSKWSCSTRSRWMRSSKSWSGRTWRRKSLKSRRRRLWWSRRWKRSN